jgi:Circularly permutated YpsA SLOG family
MLKIKFVTGGQTGVDRAILDLCLKYNIECGGWCPKGRIAEDGILPNVYKLIEADSSDYSIRTELNVRT